MQVEPLGFSRRVSILGRIRSPEGRDAPPGSSAIPPAPTTQPQAATEPDPAVTREKKASDSLLGRLDALRVLRADDEAEKVCCSRSCGARGARSCGARHRARASRGPAARPARPLRGGSSQRHPRAPGARAQRRPKSDCDRARPAEFTGVLRRDAGRRLDRETAPVRARAAARPPLRTRASARPSTECCGGPATRRLRQAPAAGLDIFASEPRA